MVKNIIFEVLFLKPYARQAIDAGADPDLYREKKDIYYDPCLINVDAVESAIPAQNFKNHTVITMLSGDSFIVKLSARDYFLLVDYVLASKVICRLQN